MKHTVIIVFTLVSLSLLAVIIKGRSIDIQNYQSVRDTSPTGPYEGSNSTSRFALTEAIVKYNTFLLTPEQAKFSSPDVGKINNRYISVFTPGVSFLGVPFYLIGEKIGFPQLTTYFSITLLSFINALLIIHLTYRKLKTSLPAAVISGFIFLFSTHALSYATAFVQHHPTVTILLLALEIISSPVSLLNNFLFGLLLGTGLLIDAPNSFMLFPMIIYNFIKQIDIKFITRRVSVSLNLKALAVGIGLIPPIIFLGYYNSQTTGSYIKLPQFFGRAPEFNVSYIPTEYSESKIRSSLPYKSRQILNGLYILLVSNERSWFYYSPVVAIGLLGLFLALKNPSHHDLAIVSIFSIAVTIISYSMFGDPWGGWSFGPRYLIPATALACLFIGHALQRFGRNLIFASVFFLTCLYSSYIAFLGALTTNAVPPKQEAKMLPDPIPYTYKYNNQLLSKNTSGSLVYNLFLNQYLSAQQLLIGLTLISNLFILALYFSHLYDHKYKPS